MSYQCVKIHSSDYLLTVTISRPDARNALNNQTIRELITVFSSVTDNESTRCVLLTGAGSEAFCAGADLTELESQTSPAARRDFFRSVANLIQSIVSCPVPVVAAVRGFALAGGCGLVAACDIAVASDDAVFGLPEVGIGLAPMVVLAPLQQKVSPALLSVMSLRGERINAQRALEGGLVAQVVENSQLDNVATNLCRGIIAQGPQAVRATKKAIRDVRGADLEEQMLELADRSALVSISAEAVEGISSFRQKRSPSWREK